MSKSTCVICFLLAVVSGWAQTSSSITGANQANPTPTASPTVILTKDYVEIRIRANRLTTEELSSLREQALAGDTRSAEVLGMAYQVGCPGAHSDAKEALRWYHVAADRGSSIAANQIAVSFDPSERFVGGRGQDTDEALKWYRKAAERGDDAVALYNVGEMLHQRKKDSEAVDWYRRAMDKGDTNSPWPLADLYKSGAALPEKSKKDNWKEGLDVLQRSADAGNAGAQYVMAESYRQGWFGVDRRPQEAVVLLRRSAEQGFPAAELAVGDLYLEGKLLSKDKAEAAKWYLKAADHEQAAAALNLAIMYDQGDGVTQDFPAAYMWYEFARLGGARGAQTPRGPREAGDWVRLHHRFTAAEIEEAKKRMRQWGLEHGKVNY
jgi:TPR repeat protein